MKFNKNKRMFLAMYTAMMSAVMLTGFASSTEAQEQSAVESEVATEPSDQEETLDNTQSAGDVGTDWCVSKEVIDVQSGMIENVKIAAVEAKIAYEAKLEEERRAAEEAERIAREKAEAEAAAAAQAEAAAAQQAEKELLASLIFCEAGNQHNRQLKNQRDIDVAVVNGPQKIAQNGRKREHRKENAEIVPRKHKAQARLFLLFRSCFCLRHASHPFHHIMVLSFFTVKISLKESGLPVKRRRLYLEEKESLAALFSSYAGSPPRRNACIACSRYCRV